MIFIFLTENKYQRLLNAYLKDRKNDSENIMLIIKLND